MDAAANSMKISGLVRSSLIDYPGKVAAVVFTQGCNFRCGFCHNPDLIPISNEKSTIDEANVIDFLKTRIGKLDGQAARWKTQFLCQRQSGMVYKSSKPVPRPKDQGCQESQPCIALE